MSNSQHPSLLPSLSYLWEVKRSEEALMVWSVSEDGFHMAWKIIGRGLTSRERTEDYGYAEWAAVMSNPRQSSLWLEISSALTGSRQAAHTHIHTPISSILFDYLLDFFTSLITILLNSHLILSFFHCFYHLSVFYMSPEAWSDCIFCGIVMKITKTTIKTFASCSFHSRCQWERLLRKVKFSD